MALTDKQEMFCREYLIDLNATQSAIRAGYSEKTAEQQAYQLLQKTSVMHRISELMAERNERNEINADYVLHRLVEIDQMDVLDILNSTGELKPVHEWPKVWRTTLSGLEVIEMAAANDAAGLLKKIKWPDKVKNLELLGKHIKVQAFKEQVEQKVTATHNIMPVPSCDSVDDWEKAAQQQQSGVLGG